MSSLTISSGRVITMDADRHLIDDGAVVVRDGFIEFVGSADAAPATDGTLIDADGCFVLPGLVNAHTHLYTTFGRSLGGDLAFMDWFRTQKTLVEELDESEFRDCITLGTAENLLSGNTTVLDNLALPAAAGVDGYLQAVDAATQLGARYVLARGYTDQRAAPGYIEAPEKLEQELPALLEAVRGHDSGRVTMSLSPMIPWGVSGGGFELTRRLADELGLPIHMHAAETEQYNDLIADAHGIKGNITLLDRYNCLGPDVQLLGCTHVDADEIELIRRTGTVVVLDPVASLYMGTGIAPTLALTDAAGGVALGTNGVAANGSQDVFESAKTVAGVAKAQARDPSALTLATALEWATRLGAQALGLGDQVGSLEVGKRGDVIVVDAATPFVGPSLNPVTSLVGTCKSRDVRDVVVDGREVVREGTLVTPGIDAVLQRAQRGAAAAAERCGLADEFDLPFRT